MCLAIPAEVISIEQQFEPPVTATVSVGGVQQQVSLALVEDIVVGDFLLIHAGYALNKISIEEAEKTLELFAEAQRDGLL